MWKRTLSLVALAITVLMVTAACSSTAADDADTSADDHTAEENQTVNASTNVDRVTEVELSEMAIDADSFEFAQGETIEFVVTNSGVVQHEFRLSNQDRIDEHLGDDHDDDDHAEEAEDAFVIVEAGETRTLVFTFPDNDHDYTAAVCLLPGHYESGMATDMSYQA